jgi:hypothetical protein
VVARDAKGRLMRTITTSEQRCYLRCREEHRLRYVDRWRPREQPATALALGTAVHVGLEVWWRTGGHGIHAATEAMRQAAEHGGLDPYETARAEVMLGAYDGRWQHEQAHLTTTAVECVFSTTLGGRGWALGGKYDALAYSGDHREACVVEHKTTSEDIGPGSAYWRRLSIDPQLRNYCLASGYRLVLWDVLRKPALRPERATPPERLRRRLDGQLYAGQREQDEPMAEWRQRLVDWYVAEGDLALQRRWIHVLDHELADARAELEVVADEVLQVEPGSVQPRNTEACTRYGRPCDYQPVCYGEATLTDGAYHQVPDAHEELTDGQGG